MVMPQSALERSHSPFPLRAIVVPAASTDSLSAKAREFVASVVSRARRTTTAAPAEEGFERECRSRHGYDKTHTDKRDGDRATSPRSFRHYVEGVAATFIY
jgi:hypothetical protein